MAATRFGLLIVILYAPGGLAQVLRPVRDAVVGRLARRHGLSLAEDDAASGAGADTTLGEFHVERRPAPAAGAEPGGSGGGGPLLEAQHVDKHFGGLAALNHVSLDVRSGETLGIIGPNGAGKTTLFEVLGGFTRPDRGTVMFDGDDVTRLSPEARGRRGLIRSFQDAALFPTMTVLDTVQVAFERTLPTRFATVVAGRRGRDRSREQMARDLVGSMGLWPYRNKAVQELSTGTRRITELACMVALQPRLLLLDEPSSGIAQRESEALEALLTQLKEELEMTLVVIEHDIPLIMSLSDRIIAMDTGRVIAVGSPSTVRSDPRVVESYLGGKLEAIERSGLITASTAPTTSGGPTLSEG